MTLLTSDDDDDDVMDCSGVQYGWHLYGNDCLGSRPRVEEISFHHREDATNVYRTCRSSHGPAVMYNDYGGKSILETIVS